MSAGTIVFVLGVIVSGIVAAAVAAVGRLDDPRT